MITLKKLLDLKRSQTELSKEFSKLLSTATLKEKEALRNMYIGSVKIETQLEIMFADCAAQVKSTPDGTYFPYVDDLGPPPSGD